MTTVSLNPQMPSRSVTQVNKQNSLHLVFSNNEKLKLFASFSGSAVSASILSYAICSLPSTGILNTLTTQSIYFPLYLLSCKVAFFVLLALPLVSLLAPRLLHSFSLSHLAKKLEGTPLHLIGQQIKGYLAINAAASGLSLGFGISNLYAALFILSNTYFFVKGTLLLGSGLFLIPFGISLLQEILQVIKKPECNLDLLQAITDGALAKLEKASALSFHLDLTRAKVLDVIYKEPKLCLYSDSLNQNIFKHLDHLDDEAKKNLFLKLLPDMPYVQFKQLLQQNDLLRKDSEIYRRYLLNRKEALTIEDLNAFFQSHPRILQDTAFLEKAAENAHTKQKLVTYLTTYFNKIIADYSKLETTVLALQSSFNETNANALIMDLTYRTDTIDLHEKTIRTFLDLNNYSPTKEKLEQLLLKCYSSSRTLADPDQTFFELFGGLLKEADYLTINNLLGLEKTGTTAYEPLNAFLQSHSLCKHYQLEKLDLTPEGLKKRGLLGAEIVKNIVNLLTTHLKSQDPYDRPSIRTYLPSAASGWEHQTKTIAHVIASQLIEGIPFAMGIIYYFTRFASVSLSILSSSFVYALAPNRAKQKLKLFNQATYEKLIWVVSPVEWDMPNALNLTDGVKHIAFKLHALMFTFSLGRLGGFLYGINLVQQMAKKT